MLMNSQKIILEYYSLIGLINMKKVAILILALVFLQSCGTQLYVPTSNISRISIENLKQGRSLYVNNCASCHQLYLPNKYNNKDWSFWLDDMQPKAKITDNQKKLIYDYLVNSPK